MRPEILSTSAPSNQSPPLWTSYRTPFSRLTLSCQRAGGSGPQIRHLGLGGGQASGKTRMPANGSTTCHHRTNVLYFYLGSAVRPGRSTHSEFTYHLA